MDRFLPDLRYTARTLRRDLGFAAIAAAGAQNRGSGGASPDNLPGSTERVVNIPVTCRFFSTLGVQPALGRQFLEEECLDNRPARRARRTS